MDANNRAGGECSGERLSKADRLVRVNQVAVVISGDERLNEFRFAVLEQLPFADVDKVSGLVLSHGLFLRFR
jgi:hypothetical protein